MACATRGDARRLRRLGLALGLLALQIPAQLPESCDYGPPGSEEAQCCAVENDCFISSIIRATDQCSIACQKRYASLPGECYFAHRHNWQWQLAAELCDPQGAIV